MVGKKIAIGNINFSEIYVSDGFPPESFNYFLEYVNNRPELALEFEKIKASQSVFYWTREAECKTLARVLISYASNPKHSWEEVELKDDLPLKEIKEFAKIDENFSMSLSPGIILFSRYSKYLSNNNKGFCNDRAFGIKVYRDKICCYLCDTNIIFAEEFPFKNPHISPDEPVAIGMSLKEVKRLSKIKSPVRVSYSNEKILVVDMKNVTHTFDCPLQGLPNYDKIFPKDRGLPFTIDIRDVVAKAPTMGLPVGFDDQKGYAMVDDKKVYVKELSYLKGLEHISMGGLNYCLKNRLDNAYCTENGVVSLFEDSVSIVFLMTVKTA